MQEPCQLIGFAVHLGICHGFAFIDQAFCVRGQCSLVLKDLVYADMLSEGNTGSIPMAWNLNHVVLNETNPDCELQRVLPLTCMAAGVSTATCY